jgi:hypothetical protein
MTQPKSNKQQKPPGEIRQSQILTTFGPGAMVDLPDHSILIGGLNHWYGYKNQPIYEERLQAWLCDKFGMSQVFLYAPPIDSNDSSAPKTGIASFVFPTWFVAQVDANYTAKNGKVYQTRPLVPYNNLVKGKYLNEDRQKVTVVPVRFVQACLNGHISDIDWRHFVHQTAERTCNGQLWLDEGGSGNDFANIFVRCQGCKARRPLSDATIPDRPVLGYCRGDRPWLGLNARENCHCPDTDKPERNRLLVRSASNAYFSQVLSVISLPDQDAQLKQAISAVYEDFLQYAEDENDIKRERRKEKVAHALERFSDTVVWQEVQRRQNGLGEVFKSIKQVEIETLLSSPTQVGEDLPDEDFYARTRPLETLPSRLHPYLERLVLVHCLKEVMALIGFTRFEAAIPDIDGELSIEVRRATLDLEETWFPAIENKGEGIFLAFKPEAIAEWQHRPEVKQRGQQLFHSFEKWRKQRGIKEDEPKFPGLPYIMLHSLSHLLITAVALDCGYAASSIRERIYAGESGYGILLFTGTTGSEGTLGGLVKIGDRIEDYLRMALELGRLCSNDPVCAQHRPDNEQEDRLLHGSACHGCLLIAETSCERRNEFLDRALVVNTVSFLNAAFFPDDL